MARIPTLQRRATLPTTTGVPAAPVVLIDDQTGQGLQQVGGVVSEIGENQLRARADAMVTQSYVNATLKMDELKESIGTNKVLSWESDPNSSQFNPGAVAPTADPDDVSARMAQIYETASEGLSPYGREKFDKDYSMLSAKGQIEIRREQVTRDNAELQAHNLAVLDTLIKGSTKDGTDAVWVASLKKGIESIDSLEFNRQIGPKKAEKLRQTFRTQMDKVKGDRLTVGIELVEADGLRTVDIDEEDSAPKERLDKLDAAIKEAVEFGAITRTQGTKIRLAFLRKVDTAMAQMQIEADPAEYIKKEENKNYLPNLESEQRSKFVERAQTRIDRKLRKDKTAADAKEKEYINGAAIRIKALQAGGNIPDARVGQFSDESIDANVKDPIKAKELKLRIKDAEDFNLVYNRIGGASNAEKKAILDQLIADRDAPLGDQAEEILAAQNAKQVQIVQQAFSADDTARQKDPAQYAIANNETVSEAFQTYIKSLDPSNDPEVTAIAYGNYERARNIAYGDMDFRLDMRRRFPKSFVKEQVAFAIQGDPEQVGRRFFLMTQTMGDDWNHMLKEMTNEGLPKAIGALAVVSDNLAQQEIAAIAQIDGGIGALKKRLDKESPGVTKEIGTDIASRLSELGDIGEANNIGMVNSLYAAAEMLAFSTYARDGNIGDAVDRAMRLVVTDNYQILNLPKLKGIVPKGSVTNAPMLQLGLNRWLQDDANLEAINGNLIAPGANDETTRQAIRENARWTLTPDGNAAELRTENGTPIEDREGRPVIVPTANVQQTIVGPLGPGARGGAIMFERLGQTPAN
jgi:hypothetical protein